MDFSTAGELINNLGVLAKDIGKGGGGSTEEPTVCMALLPVGLGIAYIAIQSLRRHFGGPARGTDARGQATA